MVLDMNHYSMALVLGYLAESGSVKSGEVAERLGLKLKHASMVLLRCFRRGFASRRRYKRGKVHGYVYQLTDKGAEWLLYKASQNKNANLHNRKSIMEVSCPPNPAVSHQIAKPKPQYSFERQIKDLVWDYAIAKHAFQNVPSQENPKSNIIVSKCDSEMSVFLLNKKERNKRINCEGLLKETLAVNQELIRIIIRLLAEHRSSKDSELERSLERTERMADRIRLERKIVSSVLKERLARVQMNKEHSHAIRFRRCINNRWWDLLPPGSNRPLPPVRGPARWA